MRGNRGKEPNSKGILSSQGGGSHLLRVRNINDPAGRMNKSVSCRLLSNVYLNIVNRKMTFSSFNVIFNYIFYIQRNISITTHIYISSNGGIERIIYLFN